MLLRRYHEKIEAKENKEETAIDGLTVPELKKLAKEKEIEGYSGMKKEELIKVIEGE